MKFQQFFAVGLIAFLSNTLAQAPEEPTSEDGGDSEGGSGRVADTDTSKYAGLYEFTYYYNKNSSSAPKTAQLKCDSVDGFSLDIPGAGGVDVKPDFSKLSSQKDPVYNTQQSSWEVKELYKGASFDTLKLNIFVNDVDDTLVCWAVKKSGKNDILINLNPNNGSSCPTRFIPSTRTCLRDYAFLYGKCKSGACTGDGSTGRTEKSGSKTGSFAFSTLPSHFVLVLGLFPLFWAL